MRFKVKDVVFLKPKSKWDNEDYANPLHTIGVIYKISDDEGYYIEWSNGTFNLAYTDDCLIPATKLHKLLAGIETVCYNGETEGI